VRRLILILAFLGAIAPPTVVCAQQPENRPTLAKRIVTVFDFEQRNPSLPIPEDFRRSQHDPANQASHPGFPPNWNLATFDKSVSYTGDASMRLSVRGLNAGLRLRPGVLPIFTGADYVAAVQLRTGGLRHARAFLIARFLDDQKQPIEGTQQSSPPTLSDGRWSQLSVTMRNPPDNAVYMQIDIEVLQPRYFQKAALAEDLQIWHEDRNGSAWFDDLTVLQLPRVVLTTNTPTNTIVAPVEPVLHLRVTDLAGEPLNALLSIVDAKGRTVVEKPIAIATGRLTSQITPLLPGYGWYAATLNVVGENGFTGSTHLQFAWLPPIVASGPRVGDGSVAPARAVIGERPRFSIIVSDLNEQQRDLISQVAHAVGIGRITLPLWDEQLTIATVPQTLKSLGNAIDRMLTQGIAISLSLGRTPGELAVKAGLPVGLPVLALDPTSDRFKPFLEPFLERFGQVVRTWQIGRLGDDTSEPQSLSNPHEVIGRLVPEPRLEIPWRGEFQFDDGMKAEGNLSGVRVLIPSTTNPSDIAEHITRVLEQFDEMIALDAITFVLEPLSAERFGHQAVADDLVKRTVEAWRVIGDHRASPTLALAQPWTTDPTAHESIMPTPELVVWRSLIDRLASRRVVGEVPLGPGVRAFILAPVKQAPPGRGGALVTWRTGPEGINRPLSLNLGRGVISTIDVFGNRTRLARDGQLADAGEAPPVSIDGPLGVTANPLFFEGIDVELLQFLAGTKLTPDLLTTKYLEHECVLSVTNPWPQRISGQIVIAEPGGYVPGEGRDTSWRIAPRTFDFNLAPGQTAQLPIGIEFELSQEATEVPLVLEMEILAQQQLRVTHTVPFRVGMPNLEQFLSYHFVTIGGRESVVLEARYKNTGDEDLTIEIGAFLPGAGRRTATIGSLAPGRQAVRQFIFPNAQAVMGHTINVNAATTSGGGRLNNMIKIE
jgi:hypothetical protein